MTPDAAGAGADGVVLLDERSDPPLRVRFGRLLAAATEADFAVGRVRLAGIDMSAGELAGVRRCRLLLGRLDVETLMDAGHDLLLNEARRASLERLLAFVRSGRIQVRAAGLQQWTPDFSVFRGLRPVGSDRRVGAGDGRDRGDSRSSAEGCAVVLGPHHFARGHPMTGPNITAILPGRAAADLATRRFEALFEQSYDVTGVVEELLAELLRSAGAGMA